mgnify:CR=1 FL=1
MNKILKKEAQKSDDDSEESSVNALVCNSFLGQLNFSKETLRYIESYMFGYVQGKDNKYNAPKVTVGTCVPYKAEESSVAVISPVSYTHL